MKILNENQSIHLSYCELNQISRSNFVVCFLNNDFLNSVLLKNTLEKAKANLKFIQKVFIDGIKESDFCKQFKCYQGSTIESYNLESKDDLIKDSLLGYKKETYNLDKNLVMNQVRINLNMIKRVQNENLFLGLSVISKEKIIAREMNGNIKILNIETNKTIGNIDLDGRFNSTYCWLEHSQQILVIDKFAYKLFEENGSFVRTIDNSVFPQNYSPTPVYNKSRLETVITTSYGKIVILDRELKLLKTVDLEKKNRIKVEIFSDKIYLWESDGNFEVYDFDFHKLVRFLASDLISTVMYDPLITSNTLYIQLFNKDILLFNTNTFTIDRFIRAKFELSFVINENIILNDYLGNLLMYNLDFKNKENELPSKYICKISQFDKHLYSNPFFLPCGAMGCLDCIYNNMNFYTNIYKCNFCYDNHVFKGELERDLVTNELLNENCEELLKKMLNVEKKTKDGK